jgi:hypothetical protein
VLLLSLATTDSSPALLASRYKNGFFHGEGQFIAVDNRSYHGTWKEGKREGQGTATLIPEDHLGDAFRYAPTS